MNLGPIVFVPSEEERSAAAAAWIATWGPERLRAFVANHYTDLWSARPEKYFEALPEIERTLEETWND